MSFSRRRPLGYRRDRTTPRRWNDLGVLLSVAGLILAAVALYAAFAAPFGWPPFGNSQLPHPEVLRASDVDRIRPALPEGTIAMAPTEGCADPLVIRDLLPEDVELGISELIKPVIQGCLSSVEASVNAGYGEVDHVGWYILDTPRKYTLNLRNQAHQDWIRLDIKDVRSHAGASRIWYVNVSGKR